MLFDPKWNPTETEIQLEDWQKILLRAAEILDEKGWCQGAAYKNGNFCALGSMIMATAELHGMIIGDTMQFMYGVDRDKRDHIMAGLDYKSAKTALSNMLQMKTPIFKIPMWNDMDGRTKAEVQAKMREAAKSK